KKTAALFRVGSFYCLLIRLCVDHIGRNAYRYEVYSSFRRLCWHGSGPNPCARYIPSKQDCTGFFSTHLGNRHFADGCSYVGQLHHYCVRLALCLYLAGHHHRHYNGCHLLCASSRQCSRSEHFTATEISSKELSQGNQRTSVSDLYFGWRHCNSCAICLHSWLCQCLYQYLSNDRAAIWLDLCVTGLCHDRHYPAQSCFIEEAKQPEDCSLYTPLPIFGRRFVGALYMDEYNRPIWPHCTIVRIFDWTRFV